MLIGQSKIKLAKAKKTKYDLFGEESIVKMVQIKEQFLLETGFKPNRSKYEPILKN